MDFKNYNLTIKMEIVGLIKIIIFIINYWFDGILCNPTNAYQANNNILNENVIFVECFNPCFDGFLKKIDHHNKNDYGYHLNYNEFLEASSVGQLFKLILNNDFEKAVKVFELKKINLKNQTEKYTFIENKWTLTTRFGTVVIPERIYTVAALDHCPNEVYKGLCVGINKSTTIIQLVIENLAHKHKLSFDEVLSKFNYYIKLFKYLDTVEDGIIDFTDKDLGINYSIDYLIVREASMYSNTPIAVKIFNDKNCKGKIMILSLSYEQVEYFNKTRTFNKIKLVNTFGVPNRGYFGGMIA